MPKSNPAFRAAIALLALAAGVTSCGVLESEDPVPTSIEISPGNPNLDAIGATQQLTATVRDQNNNAISGASVTWSAGGSGAATVSSSGVVTAEDNGTETITASSGSLNASTTVTVQQVPANFSKVEGDGQTGTVGDALPNALVAQINDRLDNSMEGVDLEFEVTSGGGSVATTTGTSGADGRLATTWTLGTQSGPQEVSVSVTADAGVTETFNATADPGAAVAIEKVSGDNQSGLINAVLTDPLVVRVVDEFDNGVPDVAVDFSTTDGSVDPTAAVTDADGEAETVWTLGDTEGGQTATATSDPLTGSPLTFNAAGGTLALTTVAPDPMVEGGPAVLTGTGFDVTPANNTVMVGGVQATVTAATATTLDITVPAFNCQPARDVDVTVTVSGFTSNAVSQPLNPAAFVSLAVGQQQILQTPATFCLQFPTTAADERYLIGVQSISDVFSTLTAITLTGVTGTGPTPPPLVAYADQTQATGTFDPMLTPAASRLAAHREAEAEVQEGNREIFERRRMMQTAGFQTAAMAVPGDVMVGASVTVEVPDFTDCDGTMITTTVRANGVRSIWLEDDANDANGFTLQDFADLSAAMDDDIYDPQVAQFGEPLDADNNDKIVIVVTKEVNERGATLLGFVSSCDLPGSGGNDGEFYYGKAPDADYTRDQGMADAPFVIAHEFTHITQFGRRDAAGGPFMAQWMAEGQATLAEEVVGHSVEGRSAGTDLGFEIAFNQDDIGSTDWYSNAFVDLYNYYGFNGGGQPRIEEAPHECTWLANVPQNPDPCNGGRKVYGVPWSILRYMTDRFGAAYPGGGTGLHQDIIDNTSQGFDVLEDILSNAGGPDLPTMLAQWAAMLYVDGRVGTPAPELTMSSWNLQDVFEGSCCGGTSLFPEARLIPKAANYENFSNPAEVRAGSTYYTLIQGADRPATAIRARNSTDDALPSHMQYWIVRIQ